LPFKKPKTGKVILAAIIACLGICIIAFLGSSLNAYWMKVATAYGGYLFSLFEMCTYKDDKVDTCFDKNEVCASLGQDFCNAFEAGIKANGLLISSLVFAIVAMLSAIFEIFLTKLVAIPITVFFVFEVLSFILSIVGISVECSSLNVLWFDYFSDPKRYYPRDGAGVGLVVAAIFFGFTVLTVYFSYVVAVYCRACVEQKKSDQPAVPDEQPPPRTFAFGEAPEQSPPRTFAFGEAPEQPPPGSTFYQEQPVPAYGTAPEQPPPDGMVYQQPPEAAFSAAPEQPPPADMVPQEPAPEQPSPADMVPQEPAPEQAPSDSTIDQQPPGPEC